MQFLAFPEPTMGAFLQVSLSPTLQLSVIGQGSIDHFFHFALQQLPSNIIQMEEGTKTISLGQCIFTITTLAAEFHEESN